MAFLSFKFRNTDRTMPMLNQPDIAHSAEAWSARHLCQAGQKSFQQLASLVEQVQGVTRGAEEVVQRRGKADLSTRMAPDAWSVAECFDHLAQTTSAYLPAISDALATAPNLTTNRPLRTGALARLFILNLEPPYAFRLNVLPQLKPQHQDFDAAWGGFLESQAQLTGTIYSAAGLAIDKVRIESPVYARISYNVYGAFRMLAAHERRHLWQVKQVLRALDRRQSLRTAS